MRIKSYLSYLICFFAFIYWPISMAAPDNNNPIELLQYVADNMIAGLKAKRENPTDLAYKYVVPYADVATMAKQVIPASTWKKATDEQRKQFQKEFTHTLIKTYASALNAYQDQTVKFFPIRGNYANLKTVTVKSEITSPHNSEAIHVVYRLLRTPNGWRLIDMSVDGVSLLESFRSQFAEILQTGSMQDLLKRMRSHNTRSS